jgi:hypothetical protein
MGFRNRVDDEIARRQFVDVPIEILEHVRELPESEHGFLGSPVVVFNETHHSFSCNCITDSAADILCWRCQGTT